MKEFIKDYRKAINPPYSRKDHPIIGATLLILLLAAALVVILPNRFKSEQTKKSSAQETASNAATQPSVPDEILLRFKPGASSKVQESVLSRYNLTTKEEIPQIDVKVIKVDEHARDHVIEAFSHNPAIDFAEVNGIATAKDTIPNDPGYSLNQWNLPKIQAPKAWDITTGSSSVVVAMLDTGIWAGHPDLTGKIIAGYNFVSNTTDANDDNGHGTWTSGVASAVTNNANGMAGVDWQAKLMPVKVCDATGSCSWSNVASGMTWAADNGAKVINMSLGGTGSCGSTLQSAATYAWNKGLVLAAASGNESTILGSPANCNNVLAVGATDSTDTRTSWSNYGPALDLVAPGSTILCPSLSGGYGSCTGTSMSSPHVAGLASLLFAAAPTRTNTDVVSAIENGTDDLGIAGWDQYYGYGRINMYKSLQIITGNPPPPDTTTPTANISSPTSGSTVSGAINVNIDATDNVGVTKVELYVDGALYATDGIAPYSFYWDSVHTTNGSHTLLAKAYDGALNVGTSSVTVSVYNAPDSTPPTISITNPTDGQSVSGSVSYKVNASDNVELSAIDFFVDNALLYEFKMSQASFNGSYGWNTTKYVNGSHALQTKAVDYAGNVGVSTVVNVNVNNSTSPTSTPTPSPILTSTPIPTIPIPTPTPTPGSGDTTSPSVSLTNPFNGSTVAVRSTVNIAASASDNVGVVRTEFYVNGTLTCTDSSSPYACSWKVPGAKNKNYTLSAKAYDASGNNSTSTVSVTAK